MKASPSEVMAIEWRGATEILNNLKEDKDDDQFKSSYEAIAYPLNVWITVGSTT